VSETAEELFMELQALTRERDELLTDMRELFAKHSELGPQDDCTCSFGDTCRHCYDRQDNLDKCFGKMRKKWGEK